MRVSVCFSVCVPPRYRGTGPIFGLFAVVFTALVFLVGLLVDTLAPAHTFPPCPSFCCAAVPGHAKPRNGKHAE